MFDSLLATLDLPARIFYRRYRGRHGTAYLNVDENQVVSIGWRTRDGRRRTWMDTGGAPFTIDYIISVVFSGATDKKTKPLRRWLFRQLREFAFDFNRTLSRGSNLYTFPGYYGSFISLVDNQKVYGGKIRPWYSISLLTKLMLQEEFDGLTPRNPFKDIPILRQNFPGMYKTIDKKKMLFSFAKIRVSHSRNPHKVRKWYNKKMAGSDHL